MTHSVTAPRPYSVDEVAEVAVACYHVLRRLFLRFRGLIVLLSPRCRLVPDLAAGVEV